MKSIQSLSLGTLEENCDEWGNESDEKGDVSGEIV
jgi:hypothetical protein